MPVSARESHSSPPTIASRRDCGLEQRLGRGTCRGGRSTSILIHARGYCGAVVKQKEPSSHLFSIDCAGKRRWMLRPGAEGDEAEEQKVRRLNSARGCAILVLGISMSLDELAIGFGVGLLRLPLLLLVFLIAVQAFVAAQLGMRFGSRITEWTRESAEKIAGVLLVAAAVLVVVEKLFVV